MLLGRRGKSMAVMQLAEVEDEMRSAATAYEKPLLPHTHVGGGAYDLASPLPLLHLDCNDHLHLRLRYLHY